MKPWMSKKAQWVKMLTAQPRQAEFSPQIPSGKRAVS